MNPLVILCIVISLIVVGLVFLPFIFGTGGQLQDASVSDDIETLRRRESAILDRWLRDESAAAAGEISATEWQQRQNYLTSRYVDVARRMAWLEVSKPTKESQ